MSTSPIRDEIETLKGSLDPAPAIHLRSPTIKAFDETFLRFLEGVADTEEELARERASRRLPPVARRTADVATQTLEIVRPPRVRPPITRAISPSRLTPPSTPPSQRFEEVLSRSERTIQRSVDACRKMDDVLIRSGRFPPAPSRAIHSLSIRDQERSATSLRGARADAVNIYIFTG